MKNAGKRFVFKTAMAAASVVSLLAFQPSWTEACSRVLWSDSGLDKVVARSMDWFEDTKTNLWILPRGIEREGGVGKNSLKWKSKYGSVVAPIYDIASTDGMNEKGFTANLLYLVESDYGKRDEAIPAMSVSLWLQYFLDNFETVDEAIKHMEHHPFQLVGITVAGKPGSGHLAISDPSGDSAVIEFIGGKAKVYHGKQYTVMTNSPPYSQQLTNLKQYKGFGGNKSLPGTDQAADRFVRAASYLMGLPKPTNFRENIAYLLSVIRNVSSPFGLVDAARPNVAPTRWRVVSDMNQRVYFFESTMSPNIVWVQFDKLNFNEKAPVKKLDLVTQVDYVGDVSDKFVKADAFKFKTSE